MKTVAIYCRVSTDNQETEGTSLQTQLEACLNYGQDKRAEAKAWDEYQAVLWQDLLD